MSRPAGWGAKPSAVSTTTAATSRFRRGKPSPRPVGFAHPAHLKFAAGCFFAARLSPAFVNQRRVRCPRVRGVLLMDMMAMVSSLLAMKAAGTQQQIQTSIIKQNADAEKFA